MSIFRLSVRPETAICPPCNCQLITAGDIIEVQLPSAATNPTLQAGRCELPVLVQDTHPSTTEAKHRGFALVTYGSAADAQDAIDNMDLNELQGRVIKVNLARPMKGLMQQPGGNRASAFCHWKDAFFRVVLTGIYSLGERGMAQSQCPAAIAEWRLASHMLSVHIYMANYPHAGVGGRNAKDSDAIEEENAEGEDAMEE